MKHNLTRAQQMQMKYHGRRVVDNQIDAMISCFKPGKPIPTLIRPPLSFPKSNWAMDMAIRIAIADPSFHLYYTP